VRPQPGIFALGDPEHCFIELDLREGAPAAELLTRLASLSGPETTLAGVNVVVGFRPDLWVSAGVGVGGVDAGGVDAGRVGGGAGSSGPVRAFEPIVGPELEMPATQQDAWFWIAGGARDVVFDSALRVLDAVEPVASAATELGGWLYQHSRDLTGFIDGTENPPMIEAPSVAAAADGSSVLLFQKWKHLDSWRRLSVEEQERVIGRTKVDSVEFDESEMPPDSHVSRNVVEEDGKELAIYRRNVAYGGPTDHGTVFVGFCAAQHPLDIMLRRMAGADGGPRDALTRYSVPLTGAYYLVPSIDALAELLPKEG
jgi:putative iron-dependent peroxidase